MKGVWELLQGNLQVKHPKGISHGETREVKTLIGEFCTSDEQIDSASHITYHLFHEKEVIQFVLPALSLEDSCARQTPSHTTFTSGHHVFPKTPAEALHMDAIPPVKTIKVLIPFLKEKKANSIFTFTLAASSRRESRRAKRCKHVLSNRYLLLCQQ